MHVLKGVSSHTASLLIPHPPLQTHTHEQKIILKRMQNVIWHGGKLINHHRALQDFKQHWLTNKHRVRSFVIIFHIFLNKIYIVTTHYNCLCTLGMSQLVGDITCLSFLHSQSLHMLKFVFFFTILCHWRTKTYSLAISWGFFSGQQKHFKFPAYTGHNGHNHFFPFNTAHFTVKSGGWTTILNSGNVNLAALRRETLFPVYSNVFFLI